MTEKQVKEVLKTVKDPELGVNIVDLGLIYGIELRAKGEEGQPRVEILMTLTTPGCPLGGWFVDHVTEAVATGLSIDPEKVAVKITFDPPWSQELMTDAVKAELGFD